MPDSLMLLVGLIAVALIFDFLNGLHDAANSIATVVSTRVLSPNVAVIWAAFFNFVAFLFFGLHVAQTVGTGIISQDIVDGQVIFGALMGAIVWNLLTWWGAIPSSSSHALIGGLIGAGAAKAGFSAIVWWGTLKTVERSRDTLSGSAISSLVLRRVMSTIGNPGSFCKMTIGGASGNRYA